MEYQASRIKDRVSSIKDRGSSIKYLLFTILFLVSIFVFSTTAYAQGSAVVYLGEAQEVIKPILERDLGQILPGFKVEFVGYQQPQAKQVIEQYKLRFLPFVVLSEDIINAPNFLALARNGTIEKTDNLFYISPKMLKGYGFYILASKKLERQVDVYTRSFCPYGQPALRELINLIRQENPDLALWVRFITTFRAYGIDSPAGPEEIREDIRQLIIQKDYSDKFFDYILARQVMPLEDAFATTGLDSPAIEAKEQEGLAMLNQDAQLAVAYRIDSSPVFLWENQYLYYSWQGFKPVILGLIEQQKQKAQQVKEVEKPKKKGWRLFGR